MATATITRPATIDTARVAWQQQMDQLNAHARENNWLMEIDDFTGIDDESAPEEFMDVYGSMASVGYANGWLV